MAVKIRLARHGAKKAPFYRVVVADGRSRRDGRFIEVVGRYNPQMTPSLVELDVEKVEAWITKGALPTEAVVKLLAIAKGEKTPPMSDAKISKKAAEKAEAAAQAAAQAFEAEAAEAVAEEAVAEEAVAEEAVLPLDESADESTAGAHVEEPVREETLADKPAE